MDQFQPLRVSGERKEGDSSFSSSSFYSFRLARPLILSTSNSEYERGRRRKRKPEMQVSKKNDESEGKSEKERREGIRRSLRQI